MGLGEPINRFFQELAHFANAIPPDGRRKWA
jgi:hypothetical protein